MSNLACSIFFLPSYSLPFSGSLTVQEHSLQMCCEVVSGANLEVGVAPFVEAIYIV